jgi:hypothetical protein
VAERLGRGGARGESASGEGAEAPPRSVAGWATAEAPPAPTTSRSMLSTRGQAAAGERLPTLGGSVPLGAAWIEDERVCVVDRGRASGSTACGRKLERGSGWAECASRVGLLHFAAAFATTAGASTVAPGSANPGCSTGCKDCWRQFQEPDALLVDLHARASLDSVLSWCACLRCR